MTKDYLKFYIGGEWVDPLSPHAHEVINPATEESCARISMGGPEDVDRAVQAAGQALDRFRQTTPAERQELLRSIADTYEARLDDVADAITSEIGAPATMSRHMQAPAGVQHFRVQADVLDTFAFKENRDSTMIAKEPIGVVGLITPWNWPINMISCKVAAAIAAGCTIVLKPSEIAPLDACIFAEIAHEAGVPPGVFNMVHGDGPTVGAAIASHPDIQMVSITGSTRAGISVAKNAADTVKRVTQELGGKSPNIILEDADLEAAVTGSVGYMMLNSGQSCNAPSRMLVPAKLQDEIAEVSKSVVDPLVIGDPEDPATTLGPVANRSQFDKIQDYIASGIEQGAHLVCGGLGRPEGVNRGYFVRPTIFSNVSNDMTIAREEIFGPVLCIMPYDDVDEAIAVANDTPYGLAGYVQSGNHDRALDVAARLLAGTVHINQAPLDYHAPFGGFKQSGNGREYADFGLSEFLELKSILGAAA